MFSLNDVTFHSRYDQVQEKANDFQRLPSHLLLQITQRACAMFNKVMKLLDESNGGAIYSQARDSGIRTDRDLGRDTHHRRL